MFWSHDLLGKKTALGAVWIAAHGKKLNKGRIMQVNVTEACKKVMDPEVPQALRLQAILVGGIVIVHAKQQLYLLEDAQEMLRRLRGLDVEAAEGAGGGANATLGGDKRVAKDEAITLPALAADGLGMQLLGLDGLGNLFPSFRAGSSQTLSQGGSGAPGEQVGDGLFVMPSLPDGLEVTTSGAATSRQRGSKGRRGAAAGAASGSEERPGGGAAGGLVLGAAGVGQREEVELDLAGLPRHDLELMDGPETFAVPDLDLPGMADFFNPPGAPAALARGTADMPDDLLPVPSGLLGELPEGGKVVQQEAPAPGSQTPQARSDGSRGAAPRTRKQRGGPKRARPTVDDLDTLQIRGRDYRDWMNDRSDLLVPRPQRAPAAPADAAGAASAAAKSALAVGPATAAAMPGGSWPAELQQLFMRHATLPSSGPRPKKGKGAAVAAGAAEEDPLQDQERLVGEAAAGGSFAGLDQGRFGYGGGELPPMEDGYWHGYGGDPPPMDGGGLEGRLPGPEGSNSFRRQLRAAAAAAQQLSEDSEEFDVETERLRAALNSTQGLGTDPYFVQQLGLTPASADPLGGTGRTLRGTKRASSVLRRDSESGAASDRSSDRRDGRRLSDLLEGGGADGLAADLGAMLPAVGEEEPFLGQEGVGGEAGPSRKRQRTEDCTGTGTYGTGLSQFELLEASGPTQALPGGLPAGDDLNKQTLAFISVLRDRLEAAKSRLGSTPSDSQAAASCQLSLFGMTDRLNRMDAAKAFYQTLVARTHGFLEAHQEEPYSDILISRGRYL